MKRLKDLSVIIRLLNDTIDSLVSLERMTEEEGNLFLRLLDSRDRLTQERIILLIDNPLIIDELNI